MNYTVDIKRYTAGRTTALGIATMLVTWFHSTVQTEQGSILGLIKIVGDIGVDMFLFASGVGLYFAVNKYSRYADYLAARFRKVVIPYLWVSLLWGAYRYTVWGINPAEILKNMTLVDFWLEGNLRSWYIAAILALYLVTPSFVKLWKQYSWTGPMAFVAVLVAAVLVRSMPGWAHLEIFLFRIPVYLVGLWCGRVTYEDRTIRIPVFGMVLLLAVGVITVMSCYGCLPFVLPWGYKYLGYAPLALGLSLLSARIPGNMVTDYFGKRSLEIYLIFEKVLEVFANDSRMEVFIGSTALAFNIIVLVVTLVFAEMLRWGCALPERFLKRTRIIDNSSKSR